MSFLKINIVLPFPVTKPVGGAKIMYEYANRLSLSGHKVSIFHSIKRPFKKSNTPLWYKQLLFKIRNVSRPKWFPLNENISSKIVPEISDKYIPDADVIIGTWWQMTYAINNLSKSKGAKFNLIQDYENWKGQVDKVDASYSLPINHLVIAKYLQNLVEEKTGIAPTHIPNAIDSKVFFQTTSPEDRNPQSIIMMYSEEERKGTSYGIAALKKLKEIYPSLKVTLFGVYKKPEQLPPDFIYYQRPANLRELYNESAIFLTPSIGEGWALPPAEAMACGCAVVCTNIGGHLDYATDGETAILIEPKNTEDTYQKIKKLLDDNELRIRMAKNGAQLISTSFSWEKSVKKMEECFNVGREG